jgi:hypothetical protein
MKRVLLFVAGMMTNLAFGQDLNECEKRGYLYSDMQAVKEPNGDITNNDPNSRPEMPGRSQGRHNC